MTEIFHNSQDIEYRNPSGAVPTDTSVLIKVKIQSDTPPDLVELRVFGKEEKTLQMTENKGFYRTKLTLLEEGLVWYDFKVTFGDKIIYYANNPDGLGGIGEMTDADTKRGYQITVYNKGYHTPKWFRESIMYQIFPDRFYGARDGFEILKKRDEYIIHYDWYEKISFNKHPFEEGIACNDFYGGNLRGIKEKLPYLKELGIGVLYLNPIFDAYSNHKYDTADYKTIDPMFGTEEDFSELCKEGEKLGIKVILDGVFSHTGADSIYFNKYGSYGENTGAYRDKNSQYRCWYQFDENNNYTSWWGCNNLPNVNEMNESYLNYILKDKDSVVKKWLKCGASGWRLDVADELPDQFIKLLRQEVKKTDPDAVIIGEVWEDASNKTAYGELREYLWGYELDSVMNYPFKDGVIGFFMGEIDASVLNRRIMSQIENYPKESLFSLMNILGTHDTMRIKSLFGGMDPCCGDKKLSSGCEDLAIRRLMMASLLQMTFYGVPCIYYGDEVGMEGGKDPYNRGTYPWRRVDSQLRNYYKTIANIRNITECLKRGNFKTLYAKGDVFIYARYFDESTDLFGEKADNSFAICCVNRAFEEREAEVCLKEFNVDQLNDFFANQTIKIKDGRLKITLPPVTPKLYLNK